jgi:hypothetical protein
MQLSFSYLQLTINHVSLKIFLGCPEEVVQSAVITPNEAEVTSSNLPSPLLCGYVKKKKKIFLGSFVWLSNTLLIYI